MDRQLRAHLRQRRLTPSDERFFAVRSLAVDYAAGMRTGRHAHPQTQLVYARRGVIRVLMDDSLWIAPPGRAVIVPAAAPHELTATGPTSLRTLYFAPDQLRTNAARALAASALLRELIGRACDGGPLDVRDRGAAALALLIVEEVEKAPTDGLRLDLPRDPRALRLCRRLMEAPTTSPLSTILDQCGVHRRTAERLLTRETGLGPGQWLSLVRLSAGLAALERGTSVEAAADAAGYASRAAFSRRMKQIFGQPPSKLRSLDS